MTALGMVATMRAEGHTALVHTAAASSLGQMLNRLCLEERVPLVNIVAVPGAGRAAARGGRDARLRHECRDVRRRSAGALRETGATLAFDAIGGGPLAGQILSAMETALNAGAAFNRYGSSVLKQVYIYGGLDRGVTVLDRSYGMAWGVGGWLLAPFLAKAGPDEFAQMRRRVAEGLTTTFASHFTDELTLPDALRLDAVQRYGRPTTGRKFVITPHA